MIWATAEGKDADEKTKMVIYDLAGLDPTGTAEVVEAFTKPECNVDEPIPAVTVRKQ